MLVIRRLDDGKRSYTAMFLPGEPAKIFPTTNYEHARILEIYKQDRAYPDVINDFTDYEIGASPTPEPAVPAAPDSTLAKPVRRKKKGTRRTKIARQRRRT